MSLNDWVGLATLLVALVIAITTSIYGISKSGKQQIAKARLEWGELFHSRSVELYELVCELDRLETINRYPLKRRRISALAQKKAVEIFLMINPDSGTDGSREEQAMENFVASRLAYHGISIDLNYIRKFRPVLKAAWRNAKREF